MKKYLALLILSLGLVTSCSNDKSWEGSEYRVSYGTVMIGGGQELSTGFAILCDNDAQLLVTSTLAPEAKFRNGDRLIVNYTILRRLDTSPRLEYDYEVRLNTYTAVLSKEPVKESFIRLDEQVRNDSIGTAPIYIQDAWFGGKYLNINFTVYTKPYSARAHFINLVHDDTAQGDTARLYLRHNDFGEAWSQEGSVIPGSTTGFGRVSFNLLTLVEEYGNNPNGLPVRLTWTDYNGRTCSDTGLFRSGTTSETSALLRPGEAVTIIE